MYKIIDILGISQNHPAVVRMNVFRFYPDDSPVSAESKRFKEAGGLLAELAKLNETMTKDRIRAWLKPIAAGCKAGNMTQKEIDGRWDGFDVAFEGLPVFLFDAELQRQVLLKCEWLPTPAEVWALAEPLYKEFTAILGTLNKMLGRRFDAPLPTVEEVAQNGWVLESPKVVPIRLAPPGEGAGA